MRARLATLVLGIVAGVSLASAAGAVLTPAEQKWVGPGYSSLVAIGGGGFKA